MRKLIFLLTIVFSLILSSCTKETIKPSYSEFSTKGISSKNDFRVLCEKNVYPFNLLSESAKDEFANSLVFVEGNFRGYTTNIICKELSFEQYYVFMQQILAANPIFYIENTDIRTLPYKYSEYNNSMRSGNVLVNPNLPYKMVAPEKCPKCELGSSCPCDTCDGSCL